MDLSVCCGILSESPQTSKNCFKANVLLNYNKVIMKTKAKPAKLKKKALSNCLGLNDLCTSHDFRRKAITQLWVET